MPFQYLYLRINKIITYFLAKNYKFAFHKVYNYTIFCLKVITVVYVLLYRIIIRSSILQKPSIK